MKKIFFDCDLDTIVILVEQKGGACHVGYESCFYRELDMDSMELNVVGKKVFDADDVYKK